MKRWLLVFTVLLQSCGLVVWIGKPCKTHEECGGMKDAYCSRAEICTRICDESKACPEESACSNQGRRQVCLPSCESDGDCEKTFYCADSVCQLRAPLEPPPQ